MTTSMTENETILDADLEDAFRVLATFTCSKCKKALSVDRLSPPSPWRGQSPEERDPHICCDTAHCPYCGKTSSERCRHLVAYKENGTWRISGFIGGRVSLAITASAPRHQIPDTQMLDFEDDQKKKAFQTATPFLDLIYEEGFASHGYANAPLAPVLVPHFFHGDRRMKVKYCGRWNWYHFSRKPEDARNYARKIYLDLEEGVTRLKTMTPSASRFLAREIAAPVPDHIDFGRNPVEPTIQFSPDGRFLIVGMLGEAQLWEVETGTLIRRFSLESVDKIGWYRLVTTTFSSDCTRVAIAAFEERSSTRSSSERGYKNVLTTTVFDVASGEILSTLDEIELPTLLTGWPTEALLANGTVMVRIRGRCAHLAPIGAEGQAVLGSCRPIRLPHRTVLRRCAFSPDGHTFATIQAGSIGLRNADRQVMLWKLPRTI